MPFVQTSGNIRYGDVLVPEKLPDEAEDDRGFFEAFGEAITPAMRQINSVVSTYNYATGATSDPVEGYDPYDDIQGYEDFASNFWLARSPTDTARIKSEIDRERQDRATIASAGWAGMASSFTAGLLDPILLFPIGGQLKFGDSALKVGWATARTAALATTAQEAILLSTQQTRTPYESGWNVAASTLMAGVLGLGVGALRGGRLPAQAPVPPKVTLPAMALPQAKILAPALGRFDAEAIRLAAARKPLVAKAAEIAAKMKALPPGDQAAADALRNLRTVETRLADQALTPEERVTLNRQRDEILGSTTPEKLAAKAAPIQARAALEAEIAQVNKYLDLLDREVEEVGRLRDKEELQKLYERDQQTEMLTKIRELLPQVEQQLIIPDGADPMQPGFIRLTAEDLAEDTGEAAALRPTEADRVGGEIGGQGGGGAQLTNRSSAKLKSALGAEKVLRQTSPMLRLSTSAEVETRRITQDLLETPYIYEENALGNAPGIAVETAVKQYQWPLVQGIQALDSEYVKYRTGQAGGRGARIAIQAGDLRGGRAPDVLTFSQFKEAVGKAMRRADNSNIPEVAAAAKAARKHVFDPPKDAAIEVGLLPPKLDRVFAPSYLTRIWNSQRIVAQRPAWTKMVVTWMKREQAKVKPDADEESLQFANLTEPELVDIADQITTTLIGTPGGRIHYQAIPVSLKSAPSLKERTFAIPDLFTDGVTRVEDFLESDVERIMNFYIRTMAPDIELARKFGTADMAEQIKKIQDAYSKRMNAAKTEAERKRLNDRRIDDIRDISAMRDRLRGTYAAPSDPNSILSRTVTVIKDWNYMRLLGGMVISSMPDAARPAMTQGLGRAIGRGLIPMMRNMKALKLSAEEVRKAGVALDMVSGSRATSLADLGDDYGRLSKFERASGAAANIFGTAALMNPWNAALKQFTGVLVQDRIIEGVEAFARGAATPQIIEQLADMRINRQMADKIARQFAKHGETVDGLRIANTDLWDAPDAVMHYRAAIAREVDKAIVTPGVGDRPLSASRLLGSPELAKLVFQFRAFMFASTQRALISGLQRRDLATLNGIFLSVGLGAFTYYLKAKMAGIEPSDDPLVWISEGIDRSGVTGSLYDVNNIVEKATRGHVGINALRGGPPMSRYASRNILGAVLGPTVGTIQDVAVATGSASDIVAEGGDMSAMTEGDKRAMLRLIPGQNLFYLNALIRAAADDNPVR